MNNLDELYYSNHCPHSKEVIQYIAKHNLLNKLSCICLDKRTRDTNNHLIILLENGRQVLLPPSILDVPSLLLKSKQYTVLSGSNNIISHFNTIYGIIVESTIVRNNGEPIAASSNNNNINNNNNSATNFYSDYNTNQSIHTPPDNYVPDKISQNITSDILTNERKMDYF